MPETETEKLERMSSTSAGKIAIAHLALFDTLLSILVQRGALDDATLVKLFDEAASHPATKVSDEVRACVSDFIDVLWIWRAEWKPGFARQ
jgi:hypothetical protein